MQPAACTFPFVYTTAHFCTVLACRLPTTEQLIWKAYDVVQSEETWTSPTSPVGPLCVIYIDYSLRCGRHADSAEALLPYGSVSCFYFVRMIRKDNRVENNLLKYKFFTSLYIPNLLMRSR